MIEFVCTAPTSIRIAIWVAMVVMHFHIAQMNLFLRTFFSYSVGLREQFGINEKLSWGCKMGQIRYQGTTPHRIH